MFLELTNIEKSLFDHLFSVSRVEVFAEIAVNQVEVRFAKQKIAWSDKIYQGFGDEVTKFPRKLLDFLVYRFARKLRKRISFSRELRSQAS